MKLRGRSIANVRITVMSWERNLTGVGLTIFSRLAVTPCSGTAFKATRQWATPKAALPGRAATLAFGLH
jgi:hypothetical protein